MIRAVSYTDERLRMPPPAKLTDQEIADLKKWIRDGAHWPEPASSAAAEKVDGFHIRPEQRAFWSFQPLAAPEIPNLKGGQPQPSPIDRFILAALENKGLAAAGPADKRTLVRRATFDLIGLPPTPQEVDAFLQDSSADAFARVVDRLLSSPRFGERWGRHWLDVARYGEDDEGGPGKRGYDNAWRYRDWVIRAFNSDMPYDLFVKAQIAGDLMEDKSATDLKPALGFFALGPWPYDIAEPEVQRANERDIRIDGLTQAFLGLTVACARCHDHKYDPIPTKDYYALGGVFASSNYHEYPLVPQATVDEYKEHQQRIREQEQSIKEFLQTVSDQLAQIFAHRVSEYMLAAWRILGPSQQDSDTVVRGDKLDQETLQRWVSYLGKGERDHPYLDTWDKLLARGGPEPEARAVADQYQTLLLELIEEKKKVDEENQRIEAKAPKRSTEPIGPNGYAGYECPICEFAGVSMERDRFVFWHELLGPTPPPFGEQLARGILVYENDDLDRFLHPEWKRHVESLKSGLEKLKQAKPDPYPFLMGLAEAAGLRNLRVNLRGNALSLGEEVPRRFLTVLSGEEPVAFKQGSGRLELAEAIVAHPITARVAANRIWQHLFGYGIVRTPNNFGQVGDRPSHPRLLDYLAHRFQQSGWSPKALIREIMLSAAYQRSSEYSARNFAVDPDNRLLWRAHQRRLDVEAMRDSLLYVPGTLDLTMGGASEELKTENQRRTVYGEISRHQLDKNLALFDFPDPGHSIGKRNVTNVPLQQLFFLNSELVISQAENLARHLEREAGAEDQERIRLAYRLLYGREATPAEEKLGLEFLRQSGAGGVQGDVAWRQYAQSLLTANEFSFLD